MTIYGAKYVEIIWMQVFRQFVTVYGIHYGQCFIIHPCGGIYVCAVHHGIGDQNSVAGAPCHLLLSQADVVCRIRVERYVFVIEMVKEVETLTVVCGPAQIIAQLVQPFLLEIKVHLSVCNDLVQLIHKRIIQSLSVCCHRGGCEETNEYYEYGTHGILMRKTSANI